MIETVTKIVKYSKGQQQQQYRTFILTSRRTPRVSSTRHHEQIKLYMNQKLLYSFTMVIISVTYKLMSTLENHYFLPPDNGNGLFDYNAILITLTYTSELGFMNSVSKQ